MKFLLQWRNCTLLVEVHLDNFFIYWYISNIFQNDFHWHWSWNIDITFYKSYLPNSHKNSQYWIEIYPDLNILLFPYMYYVFTYMYPVFQNWMYVLKRDPIFLSEASFFIKLLVHCFKSTKFLFNGKSYQHFAKTSTNLSRTIYTNIFPIESWIYNIFVVV